MADHFELDRGQSIQADSGEWYKNIQLLGVGKNAVTFLALSTSGSSEGVLFAAKVFRRISTPEAKKRFIDEMRFLKKVAHPAVMRIHDEGIFKGENPFIVAEFLPTTLRQIISRDAASIVEKLAYASQLMSALKFLESLNPKVVHRDLKPENIFIKGRSAVLGDFGLLKQSGTLDDDADREMIKISQGPGMPLRYRTPELRDYLAKKPVVIARSDIYQLGLTLTELFTGTNPQQPVEEYLDPITLSPIRHMPGDIGAGIAGLLNRMLEADPSNRPETGWLLDKWMRVFEEAGKQRLYLHDELWEK